MGNFFANDILHIMTSTTPKIIIITAPSGAGKTSITRYLLEHLPGLQFSISAATRTPRAYEVNGKDYYFLSVDEFKAKIKQDAFIEWEMVYEGNYYGTLKSEMDRIWNSGGIPLLDIDVKGSLRVKQDYGVQCLSIFIDPPSVDELKRRLLLRGTETEETLKTRLSKAVYEMSFKHRFDHIVVNDDLNKACSETLGLIKIFLVM